jgi:hypothetical protein
MFIRAGRVAERPEDYDSVEDLTPEERRVFRLEEDATFWDETHLRVPIALCCMAAVVQGMTQSGAAGANLFYPSALGMTEPGSVNVAVGYRWLFAVQNAVPWFVAAVFGAWLSDPLQEYLYGRRGAMFIAGVTTFISVLGAAFSKTKYTLLAFRILLGLGMGAKASVVPVYAAEISPARLRGRLVINWQVFDAFGIFIAFTLNLIFASDRHSGWRLMFGAGILPTLPFLGLVFACPESPRFLMKRGQYIEAYRSFMKLRGSAISAAKDMISLDAQLELAESQILKFNPKSVPRDVEKQTLSETPSAEQYEQDDDDSIQDPKVEETEEYNTEGSWLHRKWYDAWSPGSDGPRGFAQRLIAWFRSMAKGGEPALGHVDIFVQLFRKTSFISRAWLIFSHPRVRRASFAAFVVMISQQLCGVSTSQLIFDNTNRTRSTF